MSRPGGRGATAGPMWALVEAYKIFKIFGDLLLGREHIFAVLILLIFIASILDALGVALVMPLITALQGSGQPLPPWLGMLRFSNANPIVLIALLVAFVYILKNLLTLLRIRWSLVFLHGLWQSWVRRIVSNLLYASFDKVEKEKSGDVVAVALGETKNCVAALLTGLQFLVSLMTFVCVYAVLWLTSWPVTLALTVLISVGGLFVLRPLTRLAHVAGVRQVKYGNSSTVFLLEILGGVDYIKAFGKERYFGGQMDAHLNELRKAMVSTFWLAYMVPPFLEIGAVVVFSAAVIFFSRYAQAADLARGLPLLGVFAAAAFRLFPIMTGVGKQWVTVVGRQASAERVLEALRPRKIETQGNTRISGLRDTISLRNVCYTYPERPPALTDLSFDLKKGEKMLLAGESGSGKSTVVSLILGFRQPERGTISVDGLPLTELQLESWRGNIGYVGQEGFVFHTSLAENISLGRVQRGDPCIEEAAKASGLHDFVKTLPGGYGTALGERGLEVSGGQRQRIAIARAILMRPPILVFDEAMSALDNESVVKLQQALFRFLPESTWLFVAHRLNATSDFDSILVLKEGRSVEQGTHAELMSRRGYYRQLYETKDFSGD